MNNNPTPILTFPLKGKELTGSDPLPFKGRAGEGMGSRAGVIA